MPNFINLIPRYRKSDKNFIPLFLRKSSCVRVEIGNFDSRYAPFKQNKPHSIKWIRSQVIVYRNFSDARTDRRAKFSIIDNNYFLYQCQEVSPFMLYLLQNVIFIPMSGGLSFYVVPWTKSTIYSYSMCPPFYIVSLKKINF